MELSPTRTSKSASRAERKGAREGRCSQGRQGSASWAVVSTTCRWQQQQRALAGLTGAAVAWQALARAKAVCRVAVGDLHRGDHGLQGRGGASAEAPVSATQGRAPSLGRAEQERQPPSEATQQHRPAARGRSSTTVRCHHSAGVARRGGWVVGRGAEQPPAGARACGGPTAHQRVGALVNIVAVGLDVAVDRQRGVIAIKGAGLRGVGLACGEVQCGVRGVCVLGEDVGGGCESAGGVGPGGSVGNGTTRRAAAAAACGLAYGLAQSSPAQPVHPTHSVSAHLQGCHDQAGRQQRG